MRRWKWLLLYVISGCFLAIYVCAFTDRPLDILCGPGTIADGDNYDLFAMMNWNLLFLPVWFFSLWSIQNVFAQGQIYLYRYKKLKNWWTDAVIRNLCRILVFEVIFWGISFFGFHLASEGDTVRMALLMTGYAFLLMAAGWWILVLTGSVRLATTALICAGIVGRLPTCMGRVKAFFNITVWGMACYQKEYYGMEGASWPICLLVMVAAVLSLWILPWSYFQKIMLRRIYHEKDD